MSQVGFQEYMVVGSRFYYQRDAVGGVEQPLIDLGTIKTVNPALETQDIALDDGDGGKLKRVDEDIVRLTESYEITCNNLNLDNLSLLFLAELPSAFTQSAEEKDVEHWATPGRLLKIKDDDTEGSLVYGLGSIAGIYTGTLTEHTTLTDIDATARTITFSDDQSSLVADDGIIVHRDGLTNIKNSRTYTVVSTAGTGPTVVTVKESPTADESSISGKMSEENAGTIYLQDDDWDQVSADRGIARMIEGGTNAFAVAANVQVIYNKAALSGNRVIKPQSLQGTIKGTGLIVWGREGNDKQSVREGRVSIRPSSANFQVEDYSEMVLTVTALTDETAADTEGRLLQFAGSLPPNTA